MAITVAESSEVFYKVFSNELVVVYCLPITVGRALAPHGRNIDSTSETVSVETDPGLLRVGRGVRFLGSFGIAVFDDIR